MADTTFSAGTVVTSSWLNDVNKLVYKPDSTVGNSAGSFADVTARTRRWNPMSFPWLAKFDGVTDDTAAIQACHDALYAAGGGTMVLPAGTAKVTSIVCSWAGGSTTVNWEGAGQRATILSKFDSSTTPILDLSAPTIVLDINSKFSNFGIVGAGTTIHDGIKATNIATATFANIDIRNCDIAFNNQGSLVLDIYSCSWNSNRRGYKCTVANTIPANYVKFYGGSLILNSSYGADLDHTNSHEFFGTRFENNGTTLNASTGNVRTQATIAADIGITQLGFYGCYFEGALGRNFTGTSPSSGSVYLTISDAIIVGSEGGFALNIGSYSGVYLNGIIAAVGNTVAIASSSLTVVNSLIGTLTYTGTGIPTYINVQTTTSLITFQNSLNNSIAYNPPNIADGAGVTTTITVTGATPGMKAEAWFDQDTQGILIFAWVSAANTVSIRFQNETGGALDIGPGQLYCNVTKYQ